jgi:preprotein translocase subunit SecB
MADDIPTGTQPATDPNAPELMLQNIYVKDSSFEAPTGPNLQVAEWNPQFNLNMNTAAATFAENLHEVVLTITLEAKIGDKVAYLVEIKQGGLFLVRGYSDDDARRVVGAFCPGVLFPYARQAVSDLILRGGFPPFLLPPVNFDGLYQQSLEQAARQATQPAVN